LLRALILTSTALAGPLLADGHDTRGFADGSTPGFEQDFLDIDRKAEADGAALGSTLDLLPPDYDRVTGVDTDELRRKALNHPRVRALLGVDAGTDLEDAQLSEDRYEGAQAFMLASFSMPKASLKQMMVEADRFGVPIVFRGFLNNSVYDTQDALLETFGSLDDLVGFSIDPTVFTRFTVKAVPVVIVTRDLIDVCESSGCISDPVPPHDRVTGNVPLEFALRLIARQGAEAPQIAQSLLERGGAE